MLPIFFILSFVLTTQCFVVGAELEKTPTGILDEVIKEVLESLKPLLSLIEIPHNDFETGPQEFGIFKGSVDNVTVKGLDNFYIKILSTGGVNIKNLTLVQRYFTVKAHYDINGTLAFPLGRNDIHLFGNGDMRAEMWNFTTSMKLTFAKDEDETIIKEFDIFVDLEGMKVYMDNLMGGGELETVFNDLMNDVGLTIFDYYKQSVIDTVKPEIAKKILELLKPKLLSLKRKAVKEDL